MPRKTELKDTDFYVIFGAMKTKLGLRGIALEVFAIIHGFTKDGKQRFRATNDEFMVWTDASRRSVQLAISDLLAAGFIDRLPARSSGASNDQAYDYMAHYEELLQRAAAGEDVSIKAQLAANGGGAKIAPQSGAQILRPSCAEIAPQDVQKLHPSCAKIAPQPIYKEDKDSFKDEGKYLYNLDAARQAGPIKPEERREFYRIFWEKNAADPAAEARRFENYYESLGWEAKDGRRYDTPMKRRGLARMWELKSGAGRLSADFGNAEDRENQAKANAAFLKMCGELYEVACCTGDPENPLWLVNPSFRCRLSWREDRKSYDLVWTGTGLPVDWYDRHVDVAAPIVKKHFAKMASITFAAS
jgi:hypothetical protein